MSVLLKILCNLRGKRSQTKDELSELCFGVWTSYHRLLCEHQESLQKSYCTCKIIHECFRHVSPQTTLWVDWHVNSTNCSSPHVSLNKDNFLHVQFWTSTFWTMHALFYVTSSSLCSGACNAVLAPSLFTLKKFLEFKKFPLKFLSSWAIRGAQYTFSN